MLSKLYLKLIIFDWNLDKQEAIKWACEICSAFSQISENVKYKSLDTLTPDNQKYFRQLLSLYLLIALWYIFTK